MLFLTQLIRETSFNIMGGEISQIHKNIIREYDT